MRRKETTTENEVIFQEVTMPKCEKCGTEESSRFHRKPTLCEECYIADRPKEGFWLVPPEIYGPLNEEFGFTFDPCPNPRPAGYDGLSESWKESNWVNPPFWGGITGWIRKAIAEQERGRTSVVILPLDNWFRLALEAGAEIRSVGAHDWIHTATGERQKAPRPSFLFIFRGRQ